MKTLYTENKLLQESAKIIQEANSYLEKSKQCLIIEGIALTASWIGLFFWLPLNIAGIIVFFFFFFLGRRIDKKIQYVLGKAEGLEMGSRLAFELAGKTLDEAKKEKQKTEIKNE